MVALLDVVGFLHGFFTDLDDGRVDIALVVLASPLAFVVTGFDLDDVLALVVLTGTLALVVAGLERRDALLEDGRGMDREGESDGGALGVC